ncbi:MAG: S-layer homology domain-containing protein [Clostridia bacterium]|nr:S-layer homology domain-containing protein [Clostridia bacterium]
MVLSGKKIISSVLSAAMLASALPTAFAEDGAENEALVSELLSYAEQYPEGGIAFHEGELTASEDDGTAYIDVVRYGSFDGEADVEFKAIDVSAAYGKDYTLTVDEGWFITRELSPDDDAGLLSDMYAGADGEVTIGEEPGESEEADRNIRLVVDEQEGIVDVEDSSAEAEQPEEETSGLRAARDLYLGKKSNRPSWQEVTGADEPGAEETATAMDSYDDYLGEFGSEVPGTGYTLHFKDGEYLKRIKINIIDDDISETDEQAMFILYGASGAELAKPETAYINIQDTDENEPVVFAIEQGDMTVTPAEEYASVTVTRISGIEKFASVTVGTGAIDAEPDVDYKSGSVEVIFPQGVTSRTVKIPVYNAMRKEARSFAVAIDESSAFADENNKAAFVTILPDYSEQSLELYAAAFEGTDMEGSNFAVYLPKTEAGTLRTAGDENFTDSLLTTQVSSPSVTTTDWGGEATLLSNLDLRNATSVKIDYTASGWYQNTYSYYDKDACTDRTRTDTYYNRSAMFTVGGVSVTADTTGETQSGTVTLTGFSKSNNQSLACKVRKTTNANVSNNWVTYTINKVTIAYSDLMLIIDNSEYNTNTYREKIYKAGNVSIDQVLGYADGNKMKIGNGFTGGNTSVTVSRFSTPVNLTVSNVDGQKTSTGVAPKIGTNVYLAGWQYLKNNNTYSDETILPDDMNMEKLLEKVGNQTVYQVRPVFKPYPSMVRFNNSCPDMLAYTNNIKNGKEIGITMLDTLSLEAIPAGSGGYAVKSFLVKGYLDGTAHMSVGNNRANAANELVNKAYDTSEEAKTENSNKRRTEYLDEHKNATNKVSYEYNEADSNRILIRPNCEAVYIDMTYSTPKIDVRFNPSSATPKQDKDMGSVFYIDSDTQTAVYGDSGKPMTIQPVQYGKEYRVNAAYEDVNKEGSTKTVSDYKTIWQDFTGDVDGNGELSPSEVAALAPYGLDRSAFTGDIFGYFPKVTNSQIYYYFTKREQVQGMGGIYGIVALKDYPIFGNLAATIKPINDATVSVDDKSVSTEYNEYFGGMKGDGGDGYFEIYDKTFIAGEAHRINIVYGPLTLAAVHNVNVSQTYILDAYDTISVNSASRTRGGEAMKPTEPLLNDDKEYVLTFATVSSVAGKTAQKAILRFYRREGGQEICSKEYTSTGDNTGVFNCNFNPHSMNIPAGARVTVTFVDNDGITYFEHDTGLIFQQSLGMLSLLSSITGGASPVFQVIGKVSNAFGFGWDGNLDDASGGKGDNKYSIETTADKKVLTVSLKFSKKGKSDDKDKGKDKDKDKDKEEEEDPNPDGLSKEDLKGIAKDDNKSDEDKADAAKKVEEKDENKKSKAKSKTTVSYNVELSFGLTLTLAAAEDPSHLGEWRFEEFMLVVNAGASLSVATTFVTPIGVPITIGATVGANATAILVVERVLGREYYMADLLNGETGSVDILNFGKEHPDYTFTYGKFTVAPYIELYAKVGWTGFNAKLGGKMTLTFDYNMKTDVFSGKVAFECSLSIEILFFSKTWKLGSAEYDLFSTAAELYESLDEFEVSDRKNLLNRSEWTGDSAIGIASVSGLAEHDLMTGINPNNEAKLKPLGDGRYIAVYVDDVPERDENNSLAVFYTVYDNGTWSEPKIIEDDGTVDDSPAIEDVGDGRLFIAWSTSSSVNDEDPGVLESLNDMNIHGAFFDKASGEMGDILEVTKNTEKDISRDHDVHIAYDSETRRMIIYYTKEEYTATVTTADEGNEENAAGVFGDLAYPYSTAAYRLYDVENDSFIDYTSKELAQMLKENASQDEIDEFRNAYYGQRYLDLAPPVIIDRQLNQGGFSNGNDVVTEYEGTNDPLVIESDAIGYNHLGLYAYVIDYDGKKNTTYDRDVFLQIYNFNEDSISYPILLTENSTVSSTEPETQPNTASHLRFERIGGQNGITFLAYLNDGNVDLINISENISNSEVLKLGNIDGVYYYYLDKTEGSGYKPDTTILSPEAQGDYTGEVKIDDFDLRSNDKYFYMMFTQSGTKPKAGFKDGTAEAAMPENRVVETQIYMKRYDIENNLLTNAVKVTEGEGMNYFNIDFAVEDDGFVAIASRCGTKLETEGETKVVTTDTDNSTFTAVTFDPDANVELRKGKIENIVSGGIANAGFEIYNGGIETIDGLTVEITDKDGKAIKPQYSSVQQKDDLSVSTYDKDSDSVSLIGGEVEYVFVPVPIEEDGNSAEFTAVLKDSDGNELDKLTVSETVEPKLDVAAFDAELNERGKLEFNITLTNNQTVTSGTETVQIVTADNTVLYEAEVDPIKAGADVTISDETEIDYSKLFKTETGEDGSINADLVLTATAGSGTLSDTVSLYATSEQMARFKAVKKVEFASGNRLSMKEGETFDLDPTITAGEYTGGRIDDNNEEKIDAQGVELLYTSSNEDVVKVYPNGYIAAVGEGSATVTVQLVPSDVTYDGEKYAPRYATLPDEAIKTFEIAVNVSNEETPTARPSGGGGGGGSHVGNAIANGTTGIVTVPSTATPNAAGSSWFTDVPIDAWYYGFIKAAFDAGLMNGISETEFAPEEELTRAMFATVIYRMAGSPETDAVNTFADVPAGSYYEKAVAWAYASGIITGYDEDTFAPDDKITREQMAALMWRYAAYIGIDTSTAAELGFRDTAEISEYAVPAMEWVCAAGIITGYDDNTLRPAANATRAQTAAVIERFASAGAQ